MTATKLFRAFFYKERGLSYHSHISSCFLRRVYKASRVKRVVELPYLPVMVTLVGRSTVSLVNTGGRVNPPTRGNCLIISRPLSVTAQQVVQGCTVTVSVKICL